MPDKIRYVSIKNKPGKRFSEPVVLEATPRVELGNRGFADLGLTTWLCRQIRHHKLVLSPNRHTKMATRMGLEPTTSAVTGRHSNQLNYRAVFGDAYGIRTREAAVKGRCLNHLTNAP